MRFRRMFVERLKVAMPRRYNSSGVVAGDAGRVAVATAPIRVQRPPAASGIHQPPPDDAGHVGGPGGDGHHAPRAPEEGITRAGVVVAVSWLVPQSY